MRLNCTRCVGIELEEIEVGDVMIDRCPRCGGLWFDHSEIAAVLGHTDQADKRQSSVPPPELSARELNCPRCPDVPLGRTVMAACNEKVRVSYRCASCMGTWLDRGELKEVEDPCLLDRLREHFCSEI